MALSNAQYDEIMRGYQNRQLRNRHAAQQRLEDTYKKIPAQTSLSWYLILLRIIYKQSRLNITE